jgi:hypothetical protein
LLPPARPETRQPLTLRINGVARLACDVSGEMVLAASCAGSGAMLDIELEFSGPAGAAAPNRPPASAPVMDIKKLWIYAVHEPAQNPTVIRMQSLVGAEYPETVSRTQSFCGLTPQELLSRFESLGQSCDFAYAQRELGIEPIGLLRWGAIETHRAYLGILHRFAGMEDGSSIRVYMPPGEEEYWSNEKIYDMNFHTQIMRGQQSPEAIAERERRRLPFLQRKLLEDIDSGEKIFILKRPHPMHDAEALAIWAVLNLYAPITLLYISPHPEAEPGAIDIIGPALFRGYVDQSRHEGPTTQTWLSACANALQTAKAAVD